MFWVILAIGFPIASAYILCKRFSLFSHSETIILTTLLIFFLIQLLSVHLSATLELFRIFQSVSFLHIISIQVLLFLSLIGFCTGLQKDSNVPEKRPRFFHAFTESPRYLQASAGIMFITMSIFALNLFTGYPRGWDALAYHFSVATRWLQEMSLKLPPSLDWAYCLPGNAHIGMMIMMSSGFQSLTTVMNIMASCLAGYATYGIAYKLSRQRSAALLSMIIFFSIPIIMYQTFTGYVDLYGAAFVLAGIVIFLYRLEPPQSMAGGKWYAVSVFLAGCAWGVAIGTKQTYVVYTMVCILGAIITIWIEHKKRYKATLILLSLMVAGALIPCYYWFLRAFMSTGNPFFPFSINLLEWNNPSSFRPEWMMPKGYADSKYVRSIIEWFVYPWIEYKGHGAYTYSSDSGFGAAFATTVPVGIMFIALSAVKNRYKKTNRIHLVLLMALMIMLLLWWFALDRVPRFAIPALALACALTAPIFTMLINAKSRIFKILIISSLSVTCAILITMPLYQLYLRQQSGFWQRSNEYQYPALIDRLPKGSVIWNRGHPLNFPLTGKYLTNKVIPKHWKGMRTTEEFLLNEKIDYMATSGYTACEDCSTYGTLIYKDETTENSKGYRNWRIWKVNNDS